MDKENKSSSGSSCGEKKQKSLKSKLIWSVVFIVIAALTIWAITSQEGFTLKGFISFLGNMHPGWLVCAFLGTAGFIVFEALAIMTIIKSFGYKRPFRKGIVYSTSDIYFSAITPSASGGQPASAYFMMRDGIPGSMTTVALIVNLVMYSFAIVIIGIVSILLKPSIFMNFPLTGQIFIGLGAVLLIGLALFFLMILYKSHILLKIGNTLLTLLAKIHIIRNLDGKKARLQCAICEYNSHVSHLKGKGSMLVRALIFNVLQRSSLISVCLFTYLAAGGDPSLAIDVWVSQCLVVVGTNMIPIPGAMGISDIMLIWAFTGIGFSEAGAMNLNLASRGISFYFSVLICGISMIVRLISYKVGAKMTKNKASLENDESVKSLE